MKTVKIVPQTTYTPDVEPVADGWLTAEFLKYGAAGKVIATFDTAPDLGEKRIFLRVVKVPGSDVHHFPEPVADLGQTVVNHQYKASAFAKDKLGVLIYRRPTLEKDSKLIANTWHSHAFPKGKEGGNVMKWFVFLHTLMALKTISPRIFTVSTDLLLNDYILSDLEPAFYQTEKATVDLKVTRPERGGGLIPQNYESIPTTRAPKNSLVFMTSQVFHRAPASQDIAPENFGEKRRFIEIMYVPTKSIEKNITPGIN